MSIRDIKNKEIIIKNENCNNFVIMSKEVKEITKLLKRKEIVNISYEIKTTYR